MKHYVMGFIFNKAGDRVLLMRKNKPEWQAGKWNGIGGKIGDFENPDELPLEAMERECKEETGYNRKFDHVLTFMCLGGTVYVYRSFTNAGIAFQQDKESLKEGTLDTWRIDSLPDNIDPDLKWILPLCLSELQFPLAVHRN